MTPDGRSSRRSTGRGIHWEAGQGPSWCPWDLDPGSCSKRSCVRQSTGIAWLGLSRSPAPRVCQHREEARRLSSRICPCPTRRHQRIHQECLREPLLPKRLPGGWPHQPRLARLREGSCAIAGTCFVRRYPRTIHLCVVSLEHARSATLSIVWVRRASSTSTCVCCNSAYRLFAATSWARRSMSSARHHCSSSCCHCSASSRAQARRRHFSALAASQISLRHFSRFLVERVEIACAISGTL